MSKRDSFLVLAHLIDEWPALEDMDFTIDVVGKDYIELNIVNFDIPTLIDVYPDRIEICGCKFPAADTELSEKIRDMLAYCKKQRACENCKYEKE